MASETGAIQRKARNVPTNELAAIALHSTQGVIEMFVEYMTAILAGTAVAGFGWCVLFVWDARRS
jgi:hypothetical protein